jgi:hypothetical protein
MNPHATAAALPQHLRTTYHLLQAAFPQAIDPGAYLPLLALLGEQLSDRNLAEVVACAFDIDYEYVFNDIYRARSIDAPSPEAVEKVKQSLLPYGYENWLRE